MPNYLILTSTAQHFAEKFKKKRWKIVLPDLNREGKRYFPDGEIYMKLSKVKEMKKKRVIVFHGGAPKPNEGLIELELILQILKDHHIQPELFFTYFPYGRQDKVFEEGETNVAENLIAKFHHYYKVKKIYVIEGHFWERNWLKYYPIINISAISFLMERVKEDFGREVLFLATDQGGERRFKIPGFEKLRKNSYQVELKIPSKIGDLIKGKIVCLVDDLIETGNTLLKAGELVKKYGGKKIICLCTHCLLREGVEKIRKKFAKIYLSNTIYQEKTPQIDISPLILKAISKNYDRN